MPQPSSGSPSTKGEVDATLEVAPAILWDDPTEKRNPKNWPLFAKIFHTVIPCVISFEVTFSTSVTVPAAGVIAAEFSVTRTEALLTLTLYTLGLAFGPLFIAPFSEVWGRRVVYISTLSFLLVFTGAGSGAPNFPALLVFRFLAGFLGSSAMAIGAGTVSDLWVLQKAGGTVGLFFILGPFLGPILGPIAGTYILDDHGRDWRWTQWLILLVGAPTLIATLFTRETAKTHILKLDISHADGVDTATAVGKVLRKVKFAILRSVRMLFTDVIVFSLTIYTAYAYALTFSYLASIPYVFPRYYGFSAKETSLVFVSVMIGYILAIVLFAGFDRTIYARARRALHGDMPAPEHRLYSALVGSISLPVGLFWYAWGGREGGHWATLAASGIPFGLGAFSLFLSTINYLVDVYQSAAAASALAANGSLRFALGAVFPLFTVQMYESLGIRWAGSVFAFLSVAFLPIPWLLFRYGARLRNRRDSRP
ncbi:Polyamine transporter 4 [Cyphellophora attinorum]|uniref:Polyamine transporter 4 n=1 Tax=Cyphellophora attinorum TaxID=1664694 RepID=A0A0N0NLH5_9EURO|nr:Polyamine transporter 4 [Phialophora attinorum]KPI39049.1 Polyamine transporter 4 [Phialophora attinorum]